MKSLLKGLSLFAILIATFGSHASEMKPLCKLPPMGPGWTSEDWLPTAISSDVHNIRYDTNGPDDNAYMDRFSSLLEQMMDLGCIADGDSQPAADYVLTGFDQAFRAEPDWDKSYESVMIFKKKSNDSPLSIAMEAQYWISYAWHARGSGFASSVTPEGWKLFTERMTKAEAILIDNKDKASSIPLWYSLMLKVEFTLDRPFEDRFKVFNEGATRYKQYYELYKTMRNYLDPRWGGSFKVEDGFIQWSAKNTKDIMGDQLYAKLYTGLRYNLLPEQSFFKDTLVDWPRYKKASFAVINAYPKDVSFKNEFASIACERGEKATYIKLRKLIGSSITKASWTKGNSMELCDAKFSYDS